MTPGAFNIPIYRGANYAYALEFVKTDGSEDPVDLTGLGPFVAVITNAATGKVLQYGVVTSDYDATGTVAFSFTGDQTKTLPAGIVGFGIRDSLGNPYLQSEVRTEKFSPPPP